MKQKVQTSLPASLTFFAGTTGSSRPLFCSSTHAPGTIFALWSNPSASFFLLSVPYCSKRVKVAGKRTPSSRWHPPRPARGCSP